MVVYKVVYRTASGALGYRFTTGRYAACVVATVVTRSGASVLSIRPVVGAN